MFSCIRASVSLIPQILEIMNSNNALYEKIVEDPKNSDETNLTEAWALKNFEFREFNMEKEGHREIGMSTYQNLGEFGYIGYFYIRLSCHKHGYGRIFMNFLEMRAKQDLVRDLRLFVNARASWAVRAYESWGFHLLSASKTESLAMDGGIMAPYYVDNHHYYGKNI